MKIILWVGVAVLVFAAYIATFMFVLSDSVGLQGP